VVLRPVVDGGVEWLAVVMAINVMLGLAYYLRLVAVVFRPPSSKPVASRSAPYAVRLATATAVVGTIGLVALSVWPNLLIANLP
jgi:NADH-quinone oxidoreductase subunit N